MIKGAKYERSSKQPEVEEQGFLGDPWNKEWLSWKTVQLVERRKVSSTTETVIPEIPFNTMSRWATRKVGKEKHIFQQATLTVDKYEWVCLVDGKPFIIDAEDLEYEILSYYDGYYDFVGMAE